MTEYIFPIANIIILLLIFFYQKYKNKVLLDRISNQEKVLAETKSIVSQQSVAIDSQHKVVESALKYSESFSIDKIESIVKREIMLDYSEERNAIMRNYSEQLVERDNKIRLLDSTIENRTKLLTSFFKSLIYAVLTMPDNNQKIFIENIDDKEMKEMFGSTFFSVKEEVERIKSQISNNA